jgi:DNA (cytosine-5)-methyltransferase 1
MSHVDLCSGIGGFALGFEWAGLSKPVLFCDIEPWSRKVLAKHWPDVPIADDVKELANDPARLVPDCDILTAGYPCPPFSVASKNNRLGAQDPRHIYPYISEIIARKRPAFAVFENVFGHISLGIDEVLNDLASQGYAARPFVFPSGAITGARHHRNRVFIVATALADTDSKGRQGRLPRRQGEERQGKLGHAGCCSSAHRQPAKDWWAVEPPVGRVAHGIPGRVDRLKGLGNAIVPQIAMQIGLTIKAVRDA